MKIFRDYCLTVVVAFAVCLAVSIAQQSTDKKSDSNYKVEKKSADSGNKSSGSSKSTGSSNSSDSSKKSSDSGSKSANSGSKSSDSGSKSADSGKSHVTFHEGKAMQDAKDAQKAPDPTYDGSKPHN